MARYTESVAVDKPFADTWRGVHGALVAYNWNIVTVRDNTFFLRERMSLTTMLWRNSCRFAVHVSQDGDDRSVIHLIGTTLGFGPLPKGRVRKVAMILKGQLLANLARPPEPA